MQKVENAGFQGHFSKNVMSLVSVLQEIPLKSLEIQLKLLFWEILAILKLKGG